jgi:HNH endonuclease
MTASQIQGGNATEMLSTVHSCKFKARTHRGRACFSIPRWVQNDLGLRKSGEVRLVIKSRTGYFEGTKRMMSGSEIYGKDLNENGIKKDQKIDVTASCPDQSIGSAQEIYLLPSEAELVSPAESKLIEGGRTLVQVNRFERDPRARRLCIQIFKAKCAVCGFDFAETYGKIGAGFIHVHHLRPLSMRRMKHKVDVRRDLRPVCPNCHEMLHRKKPPFSIAALRAKISEVEVADRPALVPGRRSPLAPVN